MRTGRLIVLEGSEGAGKTTQLGLLADRLRSEGIEVLTLREPGGTALGDAIRSLLLDPAQHISPSAEALLFMASRAQLVRDEIDPALDRGVVVLMDRFFLSTYAYQIDGRALPEDQIRAANALATSGLVPDLTIVLELPAAEGMKRAAERSGKDRMEQLGDDFHDRVERAFSRFASGDWQRLHRETGPIAAVDARGEPNQVHDRIVEALAQNVPERFEMLSDRKQR
ncbi:MAG TPA: dTMP kinase [Gemmatimonadaceae bacterium]